MEHIEINNVIVGVKNAKPAINKLNKDHQNNYKIIYHDNKEDLDLIQLDNYYNPCLDFFKEYFNNQNKNYSLKSLFAHQSKLIKYICFTCNYTNNFKPVYDIQEWTNKNNIQYFKIKEFADENNELKLCISLKSDINNIINFLNLYNKNQDNIHSIKDLIYYIQ